MKIILTDMPSTSSWNEYNDKLTFFSDLILNNSTKRRRAADGRRMFLNNWWICQHSKTRGAWGRYDHEVGRAHLPSWPCSIQGRGHQWLHRFRCPWKWSDLFYILSASLRAKTEQASISISSERGDWPIWPVALSELQAQFGRIVIYM